MEIFRLVLGGGGNEPHKGIVMKMSASVAGMDIFWNIEWNGLGLGLGWHIVNGRRVWRDIMCNVECTIPTLWGKNTKYKYAPQGGPL